MAARASGPRPPCPTPSCPAPHAIRTGTLGGRQRYHCRGCGAWFGATRGTPLSRVRTPPAEIGRTLLLVPRRGSLRAAEEVTGHTDETLGQWLTLAAAHAAALEDALVRDLALSAVEVDALWSSVRSRTRSAGRGTRRRPATAGAA